MNADPALDLGGRVVVVTGGAGRLGRAFVTAIARHGGIAVSADADAAANARLARECAGATSPGRVTAVTMDIRSRESIAGALAAVLTEHGRVDALVNNAYPRNERFGRMFEDITYEDFAENVSMHLGGYVITTQQFAAHFKKQGAGTIVNMASIYGVVAPRFGIYPGNPGPTPIEYAAIKSAVIHLTRYLAQYFKGTGIRVNAISPGGILAEQSPEFLRNYQAFAASKGMLDAVDVTGTLLFLLSDMSRYVNGQNIVVDDGWSL